MQLIISYCLRSRTATVYRTPGCITKTCLYNVDPFKPHFHIVKLGFTGYTLYFLFVLKNIDCGYSLEPPRGGSKEYHNLCFEQQYEKYPSFLSENFQFLEVKFSIYLNMRVFVMVQYEYSSMLISFRLFACLFFFFFVLFSSSFLPALMPDLVRIYNFGKFAVIISTIVYFGWLLLNESRK